MSINAILACDEAWGIGNKNQLPWPRNDQDMKWFRDNTVNDVVVMGRKTWESIGNKNLPNRINYVLTNNHDIVGEPHHVVSGTIHEIITSIQETAHDKKIWFIGGANIYNQALPLCDYVYLTQIRGAYECDAFFNPKLLEKFRKISSKTTPECVFSIWSRI